MRRVHEHESGYFTRETGIVDANQQPAERVADHDVGRRHGRGLEKTVQLPGYAVRVPGFLARLTPQEPRTVVGANPGVGRDLRLDVRPASRPGHAEAGLQDHGRGACPGAVEVGERSSEFDQLPGGRKLAGRPPPSPLLVRHPGAQDQDEQHQGAQQDPTDPLEHPASPVIPLGRPPPEYHRRGP